MTRPLTVARVAGLVALAVTAQVGAPAGWGWVPAIVAWGWAVWRAPWPGDLLDRAVPVVLVAAALLQTVGWVSPWLPGRNSPWWLVAVVAPFVLRPGATVVAQAAGRRTVAYAAAGVLPAVAVCWPWLAGDVGRRLDYFGWGGDFAIHAETLRDVLVSGGTPAALDPSTGFGGYPSSVQVLWGWALVPFGASGQTSPAGLVAALGAAVFLSYLALGVALAWAMRRVLDLLPGPAGRTRDLIGLTVVVVSLACWPFPAVLTAGFAPYPAVIGLTVMVVGILADADIRPVGMVAAAAAVVVTAGAYPLLLVLPVVGLVVVWWRVRARVSAWRVGALAGVTAAAAAVSLPAMVGLTDVVALVRQRGLLPVLVVVAVLSLAVGVLTTLATRGARTATARPAATSGRLRLWTAIMSAFALLVVGYSSASPAIAEGGDIRHLPLWLVLPAVAVVAVSWSTPAVRTALRPVSPAVVVLLLTSGALVLVGLRVTGGVPYYVEKALYASFAGLLPVATAAAVALVAGRPAPWESAAAAIRPVLVAVVAVVAVGALAASVPRQGSPVGVRGGVLWWQTDGGAPYLLDGAALLAVADRTVERVGGPGSPELGPGRAASPPMSAEAWGGLDQFGVGSWYASQRWLWALSSTYREDVYAVARQWWQANRRGTPEESLAAVLRRWHDEDPGRRLTLLTPDHESAAALRRALAAYRITGVEVRVGPVEPGVPLARGAPEQD